MIRSGATPDQIQALKQQEEIKRLKRQQRLMEMEIDSMKARQYSK
jgi:hypothetical protein